MTRRLRLTRMRDGATAQREARALHEFVAHAAGALPAAFMEPVEIDPEQAAEWQSASGRCPDCGHWIYLADGRIGFHPSGPDGNQHTCAGAGKTPLDGADGEAQG